MKKAVVGLALLLWCMASYAGQVNRIVFFGDSLSDDGNVYKLLFKFVPKSPPYYQGRFSNGPTWAEHVGNHYYNLNYSRYKIYAMGGATAVLHLPSTKFVAPTTLKLEVYKYFYDSLFTDRSRTLYAIWIGGNDYLFEQYESVDALTSRVVDRIVWSLTTLMHHGGKQFVVFNLPDLSKIPLAQGKLSAKELQQYSLQHNRKLQAAIEKLKQAYPDIKINYIDAYALFSDVTAHPEKYNRKYHTNVKNTTQACWGGGYILSDTVSPYALKKELSQLNRGRHAVTEDSIDTDAISGFILNSPEIAQAYKVGKLYEMGILPCSDPDQYMFWDQIHPTAVVHRIFAKMVVDRLDASFMG